MILSDRIEAFAFLGKSLRDLLAGKETKFSSRLHYLIENQQIKNPWFTPPNIRMAIAAIAGELTYDNLTKWLSAYPELDQVTEPSDTGVIMAGNIPLAGFHDFLCVLIYGNRLIVKKSSKDPDLIELIKDILTDFNPEIDTMIQMTEGRISGFNSVIATGSDNSSRYFEYYFGKYPHIIRKNRNGVAIIDGTESDDEIRALGTDVFSYFGLGCRNVSKIFLPWGYDIAEIRGKWDGFSELITHKKYANNYNYHKAVFLVNKEKFIDTGFLLLRENDGLSSPVSVLHYSFYRTTEELNGRTDDLKEKIQCIIGHEHIPFGKAQVPFLWDYADDIDTIEFLSKKKC